MGLGIIRAIRKGPAPPPPPPPAPDHIVLTFNITEPIATLELPFQWVAGEPAAQIDWGDGTPVETTTADKPTHTYTPGGTYTVNVAGTIWKATAMPSQWTVFLTHVSTWVTTQLENMEYLFIGAHGSIYITPSMQVGEQILNIARLFMLAQISVIPSETFKNLPLLIDAAFMLAESGIGSLPDGLLSGCPELIDVQGVCRNCTGITGIPSNMFRGSKNITNFSEAFSGCTELKGTTPVDENGLRLWERAGQPGYPADITGSNCFLGCTQLDDYDEIPDEWKGV
jgi:hypothetical protein